jgi:hypothetical protein
MKIVIVGGGTAGWICAAFFAAQNELYKEDGLEQAQITVIESSAVPIIGAGEGTTALMQSFVTQRLASLKRGEMEFFRETHAVPKYGIRFKDWNGAGTEFLSPLQPSGTAGYNVDGEFLSAIMEGKVHDSSLSGYFMDRGLTDFHINNKQNLQMHGYHFDAFKVGEYFKKVCKSFGIEHIDAKIGDIITNSETGECEAVKLADSDEKIYGDFWIDCTGFHKLLISKMGAKWVSYSDQLPVNSALPYIHQYEKGPEEAKLETLAWAMPNGWMWQIPTQDRYGCGYVYCDKFVSDDQALDELQKVTGRKIQPIRKLTFDPGKLDKFWIKNVLAIGLSSSFLEPLQATSIHSTIVQIDTFFGSYFSLNKEEMILPQNCRRYNEFMSLLIDEYRDLIRIHYNNKRQDTEFWKFANRDLPMSQEVQDVFEMCKYRSPSHFDFAKYHGASGWGVWCWTLIGLEHIPKESVVNSLKKFSKLHYTRAVHSKVLKEADDVAKVLQTQPQFIKNLIEGKILG